MSVSGAETDPIFSTEALAVEIEGFESFTKEFNEQYDEIMDSDRTCVARVALGIDGTFVPAVHPSVKTSEPVPTVVMLDLVRDESGPRSWMLTGTADDQYEIVLEDGAVTAFAYELSTQGGLLRARRCSPEQTADITRVVEEICTTPFVKEGLDRILHGREALLEKASKLSDSLKHERQAKAHLLSGQYLPKGVSRSLLGVMGQVDHRSAEGL